ncbi:unnamed protein product [Urochloa decumbens]|uniref:non-specific serine/threonine protein kinase n=1 Tax=Urochloa decumbens TaxID=240449 RepID=A0ABC9B2W8_9POAL
MYAWSIWLAAIDSMKMKAPSTSTAAAGVIVLFTFCYYLPVAALVFNYSTFSPDDNKDIRVEGDAYISGGWIDVTANRLSGIGNSRGRASYNAQPVLLWDRDTGEVASFTTRFAFVIDPPGAGGIYTKGAGMAFFLACYPSNLPPGSQAYDLGLTNQSADAVATGDTRFVAVELDTYWDTEALDPNITFDHLGIDVNSIRSVATESLPSFSLIGNLTAEIRYDNLSSVLEVKVWLGDGRELSYNLSHKVDLKSALPENVSVGFSASTSQFIELHQLHSWYFSSSLEPKAAPITSVPPPVPAAPIQSVPPPVPMPSAASNSGSGRRGVVAATVGAAMFLVLVLATAVLLSQRRRGSNNKEETYIGAGASASDDDEPILEIEMGTMGPRRFPYHELVAATKCFAPEEKLGQGGFGSVYRGYLSEHGLAVAIKRFAKGSSMQGMKEYKSEIMVISRLRHRNLVQLVGWCHGRDELLLVYELVPNRSLDVHLHGDGGTFLTWPMRIKIVLGLGSALFYLHEEWEQCVVHRDVKPSNVMLDESFNAKLGDFGLARFIDHAVGMQTMTAVSGTPGYVDPESLITGKASAESDVYSFGVLVLEVTCGRRPMSMLLDGGGVFRLVEWAWDLYGRGLALAAADERLKGEYDAAEVERAVAVGIWCAHPDPRARPSIRSAMAALQSNGPLPALPAKMPVPTYAVPVITPDGLFWHTSLPQPTTTRHTSPAHRRRQPV